MTKEYTVDELIAELRKFDGDEIVIIKGNKNGTYSRRIGYIGHGKHSTTKDKVCISGDSY